MVWSLSGHFFSPTKSRTAALTQYLSVFIDIFGLKKIGAARNHMMYGNLTQGFPHMSLPENPCKTAGHSVSASSQVTTALRNRTLSWSLSGHSETRRKPRRVGP